MATGSFEEPLSHSGDHAEIIELSAEAWSSKPLGQLELRVLRACRTVANDNYFTSPGIIIIRADRIGPASYFVIRCDNRLMRVAVHRDYASILSTAPMHKIPVSPFRCDREG